MSAKREEYLEDFKALQRPILVEEVAALEKALQILEQRIELEASQGNLLVVMCVYHWPSSLTSLTIF